MAVAIIVTGVLSAPTVEGGVYIPFASMLPVVLHRIGPIVDNAVIVSIVNCWLWVVSNKAELGETAKAVSGGKLNWIWQET